MTRPTEGCVRRQLCAAGKREDEVRPEEPVPGQSEHRTRGGNLNASIDPQTIDRQANNPTHGETSHRRTRPDPVFVCVLLWPFSCVVLSLARDRRTLS